VKLVSRSTSTVKLRARSLGQRRPDPSNDLGWAIPRDHSNDYPAKTL
jgi:hypothetical protein